MNDSKVNMTDEKKFLTAIASQRENRVSRLIFADWLEERGDSRGELIRIEEEVRTLPVYSDRYWALKPRRRDLRKVYQQQRWFERLGYRTGYQPLFREVPDGWKERWRLIREFIERWHDIPMTDAGGPIPIIPRTKQQVRTGETVEIWEYPPIKKEQSDSWPPSLREWFACIYRLATFRTRTWPPIDLPDLLYGSFEYFDGVEEITLTRVDGGRDSYIVRKEDFQGLDPAVHYFANTSNTDQGLVSSHLTCFALYYFLECMSNEGEIGDRVRVSKRSMNRLIRRLTEIFPIQTTLDGVQLFERQDVIALVGPGPFTNTTEPYLHIQARIPQEYEVVSDQLSSFLTT